MEWLDKRGKREIAIFSAAQKNVHPIDVPITRKIGKAQNAVLADLLTTHAAALSTAAMPHFIQGECAWTHTHKRTQSYTSTWNCVWPLCLCESRKEWSNKNQHVKIWKSARGEKSGESCFLSDVTCYISLLQTNTLTHSHIWCMHCIITALRWEVQVLCYLRNLCFLLLVLLKENTVVFTKLYIHFIAVVIIY